MPALRQLAALQKEEQALQFLRISGPQLQPVLASLGLDLNAGWQQAAGTVAHSVRTEVDRLLGIEIASLMNTRLTLSFFPAMAGGRQAPASARQELLALFQRLASQPVSRGALAGSLAATRADLTDKYISQAWDRKKYIYVEVTRVQRLALPPADLAGLLRFALMIRPAAYLYMTIGAASDKDAGFTPSRKSTCRKSPRLSQPCFRPFPLLSSWRVYAAPFPTPERGTWKRLPVLLRYSPCGPDARSRHGGGPRRGRAGHELVQREPQERPLAQPGSAHAG